MPGTTSYHHYEDDGSSYDFEHGAFHERTISLASDQRKMTFSAAEGTARSHFSTIRINVHGAANVAGASSNTHRFFTPITGIDTFYTDKGNELKIEALPSFVIDYPAGEFELQF